MKHQRRQILRQDLTARSYGKILRQDQTKQKTKNLQQSNNNKTLVQKLGR